MFSPVCKSTIAIIFARFVRRFVPFLRMNNFLCKLHVYLIIAIFISVIFVVLLSLATFPPSNPPFSRLPPGSLADAKIGGNEFASWPNTVKLVQ